MKTVEDQKLRDEMGFWRWHALGLGLWLKELPGELTRLRRRGPKPTGIDHIAEESRWVVAFVVTYEDGTRRVHVGRSPLVRDDDPGLAPVWEYLAAHPEAVLETERTEESQRFMFGQVIRSAYYVPATA